MLPYSNSATRSTGVWPCFLGLGELLDDRPQLALGLVDQAVHRVRRVEQDRHVDGRAAGRERAAWWCLRTAGRVRFLDLDDDRRSIRRACEAAADSR